jgi:prevent-host-death family protein
MIRDVADETRRSALMRSVSAREANQSFSRLLGQAEAGEELVITRRGKPVATLAPYRQPEMTPEKRAAIERVIAMMRDAPDMGGGGRRFTRDEMYDR